MTPSPKKASSPKVRFRLPSKKILFELQKIQAGSLLTESKPSAENHGVILQVGKDVSEHKKGDKIVCAMWGVEHAKIGEKDYYLIDCDSRALLFTYES